MFGRQYPIWNKVTACIYKSSKSYGVKNTGEVEVRIGTSRSNSHHFVTQQQFAIIVMVTRVSILFESSTVEVCNSSQR